MDFLITFDDLKPGSKAVKKLVQAFTRAGSPVATTDTDGKARRTAGVSYRELAMTFTDNQKAVFSIKQSGDIYQVKLNGSVVPLKNQSDQVKAVGEIVQMLDAGRAKFQAKMARVKVAMPKGIKTAAPKLEVKLQEESARLDARIAEAQARVNELRAELGPVLDDAAGGEAKPSDEDLEAADAVLDAVARKKDLFWVLKDVYDVIPANAPETAIIWAAGRVWANGGDWRGQLEKLNEARKAAGKRQVYSGDVVKIIDDDKFDSVSPDLSADPNDGAEFNLELALAQAKAIIGGELMDDSHAVASLKNSLDYVETNYPIHLAEGKLDQAELEKNAAASFREAIAILEAGSAVTDSVEVPAIEEEGADAESVLPLEL